MSLQHQIGALSGTPITSDSGSMTGDHTSATVSASAVSRLPAASLLCSVEKQASDTDRLSPSPPTSPITRPDLSAACQAFSSEAVREYHGGSQYKEKGVPVYVMMPLDSVTMGNGVNRRKAMNTSMHALRSAGVEGVMMDVWWGLVERDEPGVYNWGGYVELMELAKKHGLKVQAVMSFHQCGGNVGDSCT